MQQLGSEVLLLMETQREMEKWVTKLEELNKLVKSKWQSVCLLYTVNLIIYRVAVWIGYYGCCPYTFKIYELACGKNEWK